MAERFEAVAIGCSAGGIRALTSIFEGLPQTFPLVTFVVQHLAPDMSPDWFRLFEPSSSLQMTEATPGDRAVPGHVYFAPPNYQLLIEDDRTLSLSLDPADHCGLPSIDLFFECAARVYRSALIGVLLSGANTDGCKGFKKIKRLGGTTVAQDPRTAQVARMPESAIQAGVVDHVLALAEIPEMLNQLVKD